MSPQNRTHQDSRRWIFALIAGLLLGTAVYFLHDSLPALALAAVTASAVTLSPLLSARQGPAGSPAPETTTPAEGTAGPATDDAHLAPLLGLSRNALLITDQKGQILYFNPACARLTGFDLKTRQHSLIFEGFFPNLFRERFEKHMAALRLSASQNPRPISFELNLVDASGEHRRHLVEMTRIQYQGKICALMSLIPEDETLTARDAGRPVDEGNLETLVEKNASGMLVVSQAGEVLFNNQAARQFLPELDRPDNDVGAYLLGKPEEIRYTQPNGKDCVAEVRITRTTWFEQDAHLVMLFDITRRKQAEEKVQFLSTHDGLTGLANRNLLQEQLKFAVARAERTGGHTGLLVMELCHLGKVNEEFGHTVGDQLIREVASRLRKSLRDSDLVARISGSTFAVILQQLDSRYGLRVVADKLDNEFDRVMQVGEHELFGSMQMGAACYPDDAEDAGTLLQHAETAVQFARNDYSTNIYMFSPKMQVRPTHQQALEDALREAVLQKAFVLHYQPIIRAKDNKVVGFESLLRWKHQKFPELEHAQVNLIIDILNETGLILDVGRWAIKEICQQQLRWKTDGHGIFPIAINLSHVQLADAAFLEFMSTTAERVEVSTNDIIIEVTEHSIRGDMSLVSQRLQQLKDAGFRLCIDDFGKGKASLGILQVLPIDQLKIDGSCIRTVAESDYSKLIVHSIVTLAHEQGIKVVAESVETADQLAELVKLECDYLQGWYFSKALPASGCLEYIVQSRKSRTDSA
jgi:diguanylate cyclase (GGDEF)-like protein/PAS domain S-box-containing protein